MREKIFPFLEARSAKFLITKEKRVNELQLHTFEGE